MTQTQKSIQRELTESKAKRFVENEIGVSWNEESKISQLSHIEAIDARVLTKREKQYMEDWRNGKL